MPSPQMQEVINRLRQRRATPSSQPPQTYEEILGPYSLADQVNPLPADVSVTDLNADGVPAHWLHIPNAGDGRVLMFVHGGGYSLGSLRSDGELAAQIGRAAEMHVFFPEYRLATGAPIPSRLRRRAGLLAVAPGRARGRRGVRRPGRRLCG